MEAVGFPRYLEMTRRKELVRDSPGKGITQTYGFRRQADVLSGGGRTLVAASLPTPHTCPLPPDYCQREESLAGRCPSSNGPAFTRPSSATSSPVCLLLGRSQIYLTYFQSVSPARKEKPRGWKGKSSHPGAVSCLSAKDLDLPAWPVLFCVMERSG